jgi:hypothetical protein
MTMAERMIVMNGGLARRSLLTVLQCSNVWASVCSLTLRRRQSGPFKDQERQFSRNFFFTGRRGRFRAQPTVTLPLQKTVISALPAASILFR